MHPILSSGLTLIEVLFSLMILAFALLGLEAMELSAWRLNLKAYYASLAEQQLVNLEQRIRFYGFSQNQDQSIEAWEQENRLILPLAQARIQAEHPGYSLELSWGELQGGCEIKREGASGCIRDKI